MTSFIVTIRILGTLLPAIAVFMTFMRLYYRWSRRHLGLDDAWAAFAIVCVFFMCAGTWTRSDTPATGPFHHGPHVRMIGYYMLMVSFTCVLWAARTSMLFSIIRLIPHIVRLRVWAKTFAALFGAMWVALLILKVAVCETEEDWKHSPGVQCVLGPAVGGVEIATDFIADAILVTLPIRLFWRIKFTPSRRTLLTGIFSASMITTFVSIVHGVYVFSHNRNAEGITAHILASTALMVCNLAVLVTWFLRATGHQDESEVQPSERTPNGAANFTTLRFHHISGPIVLHSLDKGKPGGMHSVLSNASNESLHAPPTGTSSKLGKAEDSEV